MLSKLSRQIDDFDLRVRQLDGAESDMPYKIVLELRALSGNCHGSLINKMKSAPTTPCKPSARLAKVSS